jgi:putative DNA primase/helicase
MRTTMLPICLSAIPDALKERRQWVTWRYEDRQGKRTKVPYNPRTGERSSHSDPTTWGTYEQTVSACEPLGMDGIGFVFSPDDPFTGSDLDKCRDLAAGQVTSWASDIVKSLNSYTELSPSGTGLHVIVRATLTGPHHRKDGVEIYDRKRFFTVTGMHVEGTPSTIEDRQGEVDELVKRVWPEEEGYGRGIQDDHVSSAVSLDDQAVRVNLITGRHALTFIDLFELGDPGRYQGDLSRALAALATIIAKETRDPAQIDRLMRQSALYKVSEMKRQKWDAPRGTSTWGANLIAQALTWTTT